MEIHCRLFGVRWPRVVDDLFYVTPQGVELRTTDPRGTLTSSRNDDGVLANDTDIEGDAFTARLTQAPTLGRVTLNLDGTFSYIPNSTTLKGAVDSFRYEAVDSLGAVSTSAKVSVTITAPPPPRHQNPIQRLDVDADGFISPIDVLLIVNFINFNVSGTDSVAGLPAPPPYRDVNGDNRINALDVLDVINFINRRGNGGSGEGEMAGVSLAMPNSAAPLAWHSDVMRDAPNIGTTMVDTSIRRRANAAQPFNQAAAPSSVSSLAEYLESFGSEVEDATDQLAFLTSKRNTEDDRESLDAFFAELFGQ